MDGAAAVCGVGSGGSCPTVTALPRRQVCFLFIEPGAAPMPDRCCTLKISPLVRELILTLAERGGESLAARHGPAGAGSV